jgi:conjugal transfer pilus assembly protein TraW
MSERENRYPRGETPENGSRHSLAAIGSRLSLVLVFPMFLQLAHCKAIRARLNLVFGETFEIAEADLLEQMLSKLMELERSGRLDAEKEKIERRVKKMILHPQAIAGISHTQTMRKYKFDPTITVTRDLSDHNGNVFARKGDKFNPLDRISMTKPLLFIDGDDEKHEKWAISKINEHPWAKVVLVNGSPMDLQKRLNRDVYFDQHGVLTTKLGIKHVPAIVFQDLGKKTLTIIEEVVESSAMVKK